MQRASQGKGCMSYTPETLQADILDLFDDASNLSTRPWEFGSLPLTIALPRSLDASRIALKRTRVTRVVLTPRVKLCSPLVCFLCGARADAHRCPGGREK